MPGAAAEQAGGGAGGAGVAPDLGDLQPGGERGGLRAGDRRALDQQAGDGLAVFVQQPVGGRRAGDGDDREQGARRDEVADPRRDRAVGQLATSGAGGSPASRSPAGWWGGVGWGGRVRVAAGGWRGRLAAAWAAGGAVGWRWRRGGVAGKQQFAASWPARVFQGQPGSVQPPVEGVEPGPPAGGAGLPPRSGMTSKAVPRASSTPATTLVPRALVVSCGNETCQARGHRATPLPAM